MDWQGDHPEPENQQLFRKNMEAAGIEYEFYRGRFFYQGWAARAHDRKAFQAIIKASEVELQWDELGLGWIVYPVS